MTRIFRHCACVVAAVVWSASAIGQDVRTEAPCSPVVDRTQGNVTINFSGNCTAGLAPEKMRDIVDAVLNKRAVPLQSFEELAQRLGVTSMAVATFFVCLASVTSRSRISMPNSEK